MGEVDRDPKGKKCEEDRNDSSTFLKCFCPGKWCIFSGSTEEFQEHLMKDHRIPLHDFRYGETFCIRDLSPEDPFKYLRGEDGNIFVLCYAIMELGSGSPSIPSKESKSDAVFVVSLQPPGSDVGPQYMFTLFILEGPRPRGPNPPGVTRVLVVRYKNGQSHRYRLRRRIETWQSKHVPRSTLKDLYEHASTGITFNPRDKNKRLSVEARLCINQVSPVPVEEQIA